MQHRSYNYLSKTNLKYTVVAKTIRTKIGEVFLVETLLELAGLGNGRTKYVAGLLLSEATLSTFAEKCVKLGNSMIFRKESSRNGLSEYHLKKDFFFLNYSKSDPAGLGE